jgi:hypothetical protein
VPFSMNKLPSPALSAAAISKVAVKPAAPTDHRALRIGLLSIEVEHRALGHELALPAP